ncbi:hypothetical protein FRC07_003323 [Ceratobasidium sp. 392]|nr:hypothetical protein FRC07_003323 [Ceratobasidium sp. 392]
MLRTQSSSNASSPGSSRHSDKRLDSDTTPSPSGCQSPALDPRLLSDRLALYKASQSLALASETLAAAAQAMSQAAASLAMASGNFAEKEIYGKPSAAEYLPELDKLSTGSCSQGLEWYQTPYVLTTDVSGSKKGDQIKGTTTDTPVRIELDANHAFSLGKATEESRSQLTTISSIAPPHHSTNHLQPDDNFPLLDKSETKAETLATEVTLSTSIPKENQNNESSHGTTCEKLNELESPTKPIPSSSHPFGLDNPSHTISYLVATPLAGITSSQSSTSVQVGKKSLVVLDRAFDELPAVTFLCRRRGKTICFWRYWGASWSISVVLRSTGRAVIVPRSRTAAKMKQMFNKFIDEPSGVLLWPTDEPLPESADESIANIQAIHIGGQSELNKNADFLQTYIVTTTIEMSDMDSLTRRKLMQDYPEDSISRTCNDQSTKSALHSARALMRKHLSKPDQALVQTLYAGFIKYYRSHYPGMSAQELVHRANEYAKEYFLRGSSGSSDEMVGGPIALTQKKVKKLKLQLAVQSGALSVVP